MQQPAMFDLAGAGEAFISEDSRYRYALWRHMLIPQNARRLVFCLLNPSTADALKDDPTNRTLMGFARRWGFGELAVVNLYAWRATQPTALFAAERHGANIIGPENDAWPGSGLFLEYPRRRSPDRLR